MKKLTLCVADDVYDMLHAQIGRGKIGRFFSELARPQLLAGGGGRAVATTTLYGHFAKYAKPVMPLDLEQARLSYFKERWAQKVANGA